MSMDTPINYEYVPATSDLARGTVKIWQEGVFSITTGEHSRDIHNALGDELERLGDQAYRQSMEYPYWVSKTPYWIDRYQAPNDPPPGHGLTIHVEVMFNQGFLASPTFVLPAPKYLKKATQFFQNVGVPT